MITFDEARQFNQRLRGTLEEIRRCVDWTHLQWAELLGLTSAQYMANYLGKSFVLEMDSVLAVTNFFNLSVDAVFKHEIDLVALAKHHAGDKLHIPEKYTTGAQTRVRVPLNFLSYVQRRLDRDVCQYILKRVQVSEASLLDVNRLVNVNLTADMAKVCREEFGFQKEDYTQIGLQSISLGIDIVRQKMKQNNIPNVAWRIYEHFVANVPELLEKNHKYTLLRLDEERCVYMAEQSEEVSDALRQKWGSPEACLIRQGVAASISAYGYLSYSSVSELRCIHRGDPSCILEIRFPPQRKLAMVPQHGGH